MTRDLHIRGYEIIERIAHLYGKEENSPDQARDNLRRDAQNKGANAIVGLNSNKYTRNDGNYYYSMHEAYGDAVLIMKIEYTADPYRIIMSEVAINVFRNRGKY